jgi:chromosome partitioning protein
MRSVGVKLKLATEFCQFAGSAKAFRELIRDGADAEPNKRLYSPEEIRKVRLKMLGADHLDSPRSQSLPPRIVVRMAKGGTGKTTIAANVASTLAMMGYRVCMIDGDPQASLTGLFGIDWAAEHITHIGHLLHQFSLGQDPNFEHAVRPIYPNRMLDLVAADITMASTDKWLMSVTSRETLFRRFLEAHVEFFSRYDVIILDAAPSTTTLTQTFMCAAETLLAVVWLDGQSIKAMSVLAADVSELNQLFHGQGLHLKVHIVANGFHPSYQPCRDSLGMLSQAYPRNLNDNVIPHSATFMRQVDLSSDSKSGPALEREPNSIAARAMIDLTKSLIREYDIRLAGQTESITLTRGAV